VGTVELPRYLLFDIIGRPELGPRVQHLSASCDAPSWQIWDHMAAAVENSS
jgi:hypothetical protein